MSRSLRTFTPDQDADLGRKYEAGATVADLCRETGETYQSVSSALRRAGTQTRKPTRNWTGSPEQVAEVVRLYGEGKSVRMIAKILATRDSYITKTLHDEGVEVRLGGFKHRRFTDDESQQISQRYQAGEPVAVIAGDFGSSDMTIYNTLKRLGVFEKKAPNRTWTEQRLAWLREQFEAGRTVSDLADEIGLKAEAVKMRLRQAGVSQKRVAAPRRLDANGYAQVRPTEDDLRVIEPMATGYVQEHRLILARALNRPLLRTETVHHINGDRTDNRLQNLQLRHGQHGPGVVMTCNRCGSHDVTAQVLP